MNRWDYYSLRKIKQIISRKALKKEIKNYANRTIMDLKAGNNRIACMIESGRPMAVSRFGSTELSVILRREAHKNHRFYKNNDLSMGGATQLLFGIKGARWDNSTGWRYNEYWVRPDESEQCKNQSIVEGGCYW